jgi:hypothetical protein
MNYELGKREESYHVVKLEHGRERLDALGAAVIGGKLAQQHDSPVSFNYDHNSTQAGSVRVRGAGFRRWCGTAGRKWGRWEIPRGCVG